MLHVAAAPKVLIAPLVSCEEQGRRAYFNNQPYSPDACAAWRDGWLAANKMEASAYVIEIIEMGNVRPPDWPGPVEQGRIAAKSHTPVLVCLEDLLLSDEPGYFEGRYPYLY